MSAYKQVHGEEPNFTNNAKVTGVNELLPHVLSS